MQRDISDHSFYAWRRSLSGGYAVQFAELKTIDIPASADALELILYFKALKQNLTVKTFVGSSENALRIQIWTDLDSLDRPAPAQMAASPFPSQLVFVQSCLDAPAEPVHLP